MNPANAAVPVISAVILAAGASTRMGRPKQLLPWGGVPMVRHVAQTFAKSAACEVIVVVGCRADAVARAVLGDERGVHRQRHRRQGDQGPATPIRVAVNAAWEDGMAASVACGVGAARAGAEAFLIAVGPSSRNVDVINALIASFAQRSPAERVRAVIAPAHGRPPVLLSAGLRDELERWDMQAGREPRALSEYRERQHRSAWSLVESHRR